MYKGRLIHKDKNYVAGWIKDANKEEPVRIKILSNGNVIKVLIANRRFKNDKNKALGYHGFRISLEHLIKAGAKKHITIQSEDGAFKFRQVEIPDIKKFVNNKMDLNKRQINKTNIFLVGGKSNSGKSSFTEELSKQLNNVYILNTDEIFKNDMYPSNVHSKIIGYVKSEMFNREDFVRLFINEYLPEIPFNAKTTIIIEGWVLTFEWIRKKLVQVLNVFGSPYYIEVEDFKIKFRGNKFEKSLSENAKDFYTFYKKLRLEELSKRTTYQFYEDLGQKAKNSNSKIKIEKAAIPDLKGKVILDVGCNAGYMSNNFARSGAKMVYGIDVRRVSVSVASQYNNIFYQSSNVKFYHIDVYDINPDHPIDIVYASSVFHYFRDNQYLFFEHMQKIMSPEGLMIIEIELYEGSQDKAFIYKYKRPVDETDCYFPNQKMLDDMIQGKFTIESKVLSVNQKGSKLKRYFFHLKKNI